MVDRDAARMLIIISFFSVHYNYPEIFEDYHTDDLQSSYLINKIYTQKGGCIMNNYVFIQKAQIIYLYY